MAKGFASRMTSSAPDRLVSKSASRFSSGASSVKPAITQERTTEGVHPAMSIYSSSAGYPNAAISRGLRRTRMPNAQSRNPQCRPDTAVICVSPASDRLPLLCVSSPSRSPVSRAVIKPAAAGS